jgi:protein-S-isoprenylcysteine O-methyltransferase Ste14
MRWIRALVLNCAALILPTWIEPAFLTHAQPWILVCIGVLATVFQPEHSPVGTQRTAQDQWTANQILFSIYAVQTSALVESTWCRYPESMDWNAWSLVGLLMMILGLGLRTWAVRTLGKFFTWHVELQNDQTVITHGPYRWVRHPSYTGALMTWAFTTIFLQAWYAALLALVLLPLAFWRRIHHEETLLRAELKDYDDYAKRVKALIPGVL